MNKARIIALTIFAACSYGVIHDQITIRISPEYFVVGHSLLFHTTSLTVLAVCWGVVSTFAIGTILGSLLALVSQSSGPAPWPVARLGRAMLLILSAMALSAFACGVAGFELSKKGLIVIPAVFGELIPESHHHRFMGVWFAHGGSYFVGLVGSACLCLQIWVARGRPRFISLYPQTRFAAIRTVIVILLAAAILWFRFGNRSLPD